MTNHPSPFNADLCRSLIMAARSCGTVDVLEIDMTRAARGDQIRERSFIPVGVAEKALRDRVQSRLDRLSQQSEQRTQLPND